MNEIQTFEEVIEERRRAWAAPGAAPVPDNAPVSAASATDALGFDAAELLDQTMPLPRYRPERLF